VAVDHDLLDILACPLTKVPVKPLTKDRLAILNAEIARGSVADRQGNRVAAPLEEALITVDGKTIYVVEDGTPNMLSEHGIAAHQVPGW